MRSKLYWLKRLNVVHRVITVSSCIGPCFFRADKSQMVSSLECFFIQEICRSRVNDGCLRVPWKNSYMGVNYQCPTGARHRVSL